MKLTRASPASCCSGRVLVRDLRLSNVMRTEHIALDDDDIPADYSDGDDDLSANGSELTAAQAPVHLLRCATCETELTRRGMQVRHA